jgi:hypothetical protein
MSLLVSVFPREKKHADTEILVAEQLLTQPFDFPAEQLMGDLSQDTRAITGLGIGIHRPAMDQPANTIQGLLQDGMGLGPVNAGDEADAATVMFQGGVIKTLRPGIMAKTEL